MTHAEEERTTNTSGESGLSGPRSRLGLVRAKPSPSSDFFKIYIYFRNIYSYVKDGREGCLRLSDDIMHFGLVWITMLMMH